MVFLKHKFAHVIFPAINSSWAFHCSWDNGQSSLVRTASKAFHSRTLAPTGVMSAGPGSELPPQASPPHSPLKMSQTTCLSSRTSWGHSCCEVDVPASVLLTQWILSHVHVRYFIYILLLMLILASFSFSFRKLSRNSVQGYLSKRSRRSRKRCSMYKRTEDRDNSLSASSIQKFYEWL